MAEPRKNPLLAVSGGKKREQPQEKPMSKDEIMSAFAPDEEDVAPDPVPEASSVQVQAESVPVAPQVSVPPVNVPRESVVKEDAETYNTVSHESTLYSLPARSMPAMPPTPAPIPTPTPTPAPSYEYDLPPMVMPSQERATIELPPMPPVKRKRHKGLRFGDIYETRSLSIDKRLLPYFDDYLESGDTKTALANQIVLKILIDAGYPIDPTILVQPFKKNSK